MNRRKAFIVGTITLGIVLAILLHLWLRRNPTDVTVLAARSAIQTHHLSTVSADCLQVQVSKEERGVQRIDVYEDHSRGGCDGDPAMTPRLFSLEIKDGIVVASDRDSPDGSMLPLRK